MTTATDATKFAIDLPAGFVGMPLGSSPGVNAYFAEQVAHRVADRGGPPAAEFAPNLLTFAQEMSDPDLRVFGKFAVGDADPSTAALALAVLPLDDERGGRMPSSAERDQLVRALIRVYVQRVPDADVRPITLPMGPALAAVTTGEFRVPAGHQGRATETVIPVFRVELQIPTPDARHLVIMSVNSNDERHFTLVAQQTLEIARTLRVDESGAE